MEGRREEERGGVRRAEERGVEQGRRRRVRRPRLIIQQGDNEPALSDTVFLDCQWLMRLMGTVTSSTLKIKGLISFFFLFSLLPPFMLCLLFPQREFLHGPNSSTSGGTTRTPTTRRCLSSWNSSTSFSACREPTRIPLRTIFLYYSSLFVPLLYCYVFFITLKIPHPHLPARRAPKQRT